MIEVEKKFQPTDEQLAHLLEDAKFMSEKEHTDIYYDLSDFSYFKQGMHFRKRNSEYELKVEISNSQKYNTGRYEEISSEQEILEKLGFDKNDSLAEIIKEKMIILCSIKTKRKKYKKDEFTIDIDETDFGYNVIEIELLVDSEKEIEKAEVKILTLAKQFNFPIKKLHGKVSECLRITRPEVYKKLYTF